VDFPALLPDGTPAALSVSPVISGRPGAREAVSEALREASGALPAGPEGPDQSEIEPAYPAGEDANGNGQNGARP